MIIFYRPLADRFGRKPFLVINTLMMGIGLFLVYLSDNIFMYMVGSTIMGFMVSHDMQCVYILECSDEKTRARNYAMIKAVAILGTLLIPLLRETLMQNQSERWHLVYLVPAIIGCTMSLAALVFARETIFLFRIPGDSYLQYGDEGICRDDGRSCHGGIVSVSCGKCPDDICRGNGF